MGDSVSAYYDRLEEEEYARITAENAEKGRSAKYRIEKTTDAQLGSRLVSIEHTISALKKQLDNIPLTRRNRESFDRRIECLDVLVKEISR